jgi:DNA replication protein DnaD
LDTKFPDTIEVETLWEDTKTENGGNMAKIDPGDLTDWLKQKTDVELINEAKKIRKRIVTVNGFEISPDSSDIMIFENILLELKNRGFSFADFL